MSTRFVTTYESDEHENYKQTYINAREEDIGIIKSPVGMQGREIHKRFIDQINMTRVDPKHCYPCIEKCNPSTTPYCITQALINAANGNVEDALLFCGTNAFQATKLESVKDIINEFIDED